MSELPRRRRWPRVLAVIAGLLAVAYVWFFIPGASATGDWSIDLAEVRRLAGSMAGDKPTELRVERVGQFKFPYAILRAGGSWSMRPMTIFAYQAVFPTHTAIIDTAQNEPIPGGDLDAASFERLSKAMAAADLIVVTHEHGDHLSGLAIQPNVKELLKVTKLNKEQVDHPELMKPSKGFPPGALDGYQPITYDKYLAVAPGVVLIRAAGHTPGSQLVFVQKADGTEVLFLGDVAWAQLNVDEVVERPRAIAAIAGMDRGLLMRQLEQLHALRQAEPKLNIVYGHDVEPLNALVAQHVLEEKFKLP